jgi:asparagine synthetase B (glutamine-hydrolysing)
LFAEAVRRRLHVDVPLGVFLSGGLDSAIVVAALSEASDAPIRTYTIGVPGHADYDETRPAAAVARHFGTRHTEYPIQPASFDLIEKLVLAHDSPFSDSSAIPTSMLASYARSQVPVVLSGDGGDELFAGYTRFSFIEGAEWLPRRLLEELTKWGRLKGEPSTHFWRKLGRLVTRSALPIAERTLSWQALFLPNAEFIRPELFAPIDEPIAIFRDLLSGREPSSLAKILKLNFETYPPTTSWSRPTAAP